VRRRKEEFSEGGLQPGLTKQFTLQFESMLFALDGIEKARNALPPFLLQDVAEKTFSLCVCSKGATDGRQPMLARSRVAGQDSAAVGCCLLALQFASRHQAWPFLT
jgi:hypothetical protein